MERSGGSGRDRGRFGELGTHETEIFAVLDDAELGNRYWDGESWHDWDRMGGPFRGTPAASARHGEIPHAAG
jgi:hypothetical protein